jgi:hypothetical protein
VCLLRWDRPLHDGEVGVLSTLVPFAANNDVQITSISPAYGDFGANTVVQLNSNRMIACLSSAITAVHFGPSPTAATSYGTCLTVVWLSNQQLRCTLDGTLVPFNTPIYFTVLVNNVPSMVSSLSYIASGGDPYQLLAAPSTLPQAATQANFFATFFVQPPTHTGWVSTFNRSGTATHSAVFGTGVYSLYDNNGPSAAAPYLLAGAYYDLYSALDTYPSTPLTGVNLPTLHWTVAMWLTITAALPTTGTGVTFFSCSTTGTNDQVTITQSAPPATGVTFLIRVGASTIGSCTTPTGKLGIGTPTHIAVTFDQNAVMKVYGTCMWTHL